MDAVVIVVLVVVAVGVAVAAHRRRTAQQARARAAAPRRDPMAAVHGNEEYLQRLKVGDVVAYEGSDYLVRGSLHFDEEGYTWSEHLISEGEVQHWLSVEDDEGLRIILWQRVGRGELDGEPGAKTVRHGQLAYTLQEDGQASYRAEGTTGTAPTGTASYADYQGADGALLSCERFGRSWEVSVGREVLPRSLDVYPVTG